MTVGEHLATLQAELEELKRARHTGVEAEIAAASGTQPVRTIVVRSSKGW
jgi:hypothetical protein